MKPYIVAFIGNREVFESNAVLETLIAKLEKLFIEDNSLLKVRPVFYCGGYGQFSQIASEAIDILRKRHPKFKSEKLFVTPYIVPSYQKTLDYMKAFYDGIIYPPLEKVPLRYAISRRNQWMIDKCDLLIAYMKDTCGNTRKCVNYAYRKKKFVLYIKVQE